MSVVTEKNRAVQSVAKAANAIGGPNNLSQLMPSREALEAIRLKREREEAERATREEDEKAFTAQCERRLMRIEKWAKNQSRNELIEHLSMAVLLLIEKNKTARQADRSHRVMKGIVDDATSYANATKSVAMDFLRENIKNKQDRQKGVAEMLARSPKTKPMDKIKAEFNRWQEGAAKYKNDSDFAKKMHDKHAEAITNEGSIKNACIRWRKERKNHPAS